MWVSRVIPQALSTSKIVNGGHKNSILRLSPLLNKHLSTFSNQIQSVVLDHESPKKVRNYHLLSFFLFPLNFQGGFLVLLFLAKIYAVTFLWFSYYLWGVCVYRIGQTNIVFILSIGVITSDYLVLFSGLFLLSNCIF